MQMGRSSNSSDYQLSANRLISRVHVKARYVPATEALEPNQIEIVCCGWNGLKLHCQGRTWDLNKGDTFTSATENAEIMLDVQDARVRIQWPKKDRSDVLSAISDWDDSPRSKALTRSIGRGAPGTPDAPGVSSLQSSPLRRTRIASPVSPTPAGVPASGASLQALLSQQLGSDDEEDASPAIQIYEDGSADELDLPKHNTNTADMSFATDVMDSFSSELSDIHSDDEAESSQDHTNDDPDEENDPIIHSFGPFGANLSNRLASFTTLSPQIERRPMSRISEGSITSVGSDDADDVKHEPKHKHESKHRVKHEAKSAQHRRAVRTPSPRPEKRRRVGGENSDDEGGAHGEVFSDGVGLGITVAQGAEAHPKSTVPEISSHVDIATVRNHLINQLAFSRLSSSPLSTIMSNLPSEERRDLTLEGLRYIIEGTKCVGVILRQGKDAAGQPLESEYYYVADLDEDLSRKAVVDGLHKPSLRNCRKQHKQYYWKKPRTP